MKTILHNKLHYNNYYWKWFVLTIIIIIVIAAAADDNIVINRRHRNHYYRNNNNNNIKNNNKNNIINLLHFNNTSSSSPLITIDDKMITSQLERVPPIPNTTEYNIEDILNRDTTRNCGGMGEDELKSHNSHNHHPHHHHHHHHESPHDRNHHRQKRRDTRKPLIDDYNSNQKRIEFIKQQILSKLGLNSIPNIKSQISSKFPFDLIESKTMQYSRDEEMTTNGRPIPTSTDSETELDDSQPRTSEIIEFAKPGYTINNQKLLEFSWSQDVNSTNLNIRSAILWVRLEFHPSLPTYQRNTFSQNRNYTIWVFQYSKVRESSKVSDEEFEEHSSLADQLVMQISSLGWLTFNVTETMRNWYSSSRYSGLANPEPLRLLLECSGGCDGLITPVLFDDPRQSSEWEKPFLVINAEETITKRVKRRAIDCSFAKPDQCCKQEFYIKFSDLGWNNWIIAPTGYYANYCQGGCGGIHRTPDSYLNGHTNVQEQYRRVMQYSPFEPCCAPIKFSSISLIYITPDNNIVKRDLPKMVVEECGCP